MATMNLQELAAQFNIQVNPKPITLELATEEEQTQQAEQKETLNVWGYEPSDWSGKMSRLRDILPICFYDHKQTQKNHLMVLEDYRLIRNKIQCAPHWIRSTNKFSSLQLPYEEDVINHRVDQDLEHLNLDLQQAVKNIKNLEAEIKKIENLPNEWEESEETFYSHRDPFTDKKDYGISTEIKRFKRPQHEIDANSIRLEALKASLKSSKDYATMLHQTIATHEERLEDLYSKYLEDTVSGTEV